MAYHPTKAIQNENSQRMTSDSLLLTTAGHHRVKVVIGVDAGEDTAGMHTCEVAAGEVCVDRYS